MAINNFKPFATAANANVMSQADWEGLPALLSGFTSGKAASAEVNKAIRQASFIAAALAQYTANKSGLDVLDDADLNGFITKMTTAFGKDFQALDATLTALAGLATGANKLPYFTGNDTAAQTDLTSVGRDIIGKNTIADILAYLGLGAIATATDISNGTVKKLVDAFGLIGAIASNTDIQNATARKFVDAAGLIGAIGTLADVTSGSLRKFVNSLTLSQYLPVKALSGNGFLRIPDVPGGTIIQWGQVTGTINEGTQNVTLPTPFPTTARFATAIPLNQTGNTTCDLVAQLQSASTTGINFFFSWPTSTTPATGFQWFAIGY